MILWDFGYNLPLKAVPFDNKKTLKDLKKMDETYMGMTIYNIDELNKDLPSFDSFDDDTIFAVPITVLQYDFGYTLVQSVNYKLNEDIEDDYNLNMHIRGYCKFKRFLVHIYSYLSEFVLPDNYDKLTFPDIITPSNSTYKGLFLNSDKMRPYWDILYNKHYNKKNFDRFFPKRTINLLDI